MFALMVRKVDVVERIDLSDNNDAMLYVATYEKCMFFKKAVAHNKYKFVAVENCWYHGSVKCDAKLSHRLDKVLAYIVSYAGFQEKDLHKVSIAL
ncbi:MAG: hypothetical protein ACRC3J_01820 [Culicoidibacterales bacterium]